MLVYKLFVIN